VDRFAWDRDRDDPAQERIITDWIDALEDYPLSEIQAACKAALRGSAKVVPHEGTILRLIADERQRRVADRDLANDTGEPWRPVSERVTKEQAQSIVDAAGFGVKRFGAKKGVDAASE
jgi:hypothetical protein